MTNKNTFRVLPNSHVAEPRPDDEPTEDCITVPGWQPQKSDEAESDADETCVDGPRQRH
jgi:hypothetical protein